MSLSSSLGLVMLILEAMLLGVYNSEQKYRQPCTKPLIHRHAVERIVHASAATLRSVHSTCSERLVSSFLRPCLLDCLEAGHSLILAGFSSNLHDKKPDKILQNPIAAMSAQHVEILNLQRAATRFQSVVDLAVIIQEVHSSLGNLLTREVVRLQFYGRRELRDGWSRRSDP